MEEETYNQQTKLLLALSKSAKDLKTMPIPFYSTTNFVAIKTILELETQLRTLFCNDPMLLNLFRSLSHLETQLTKLQISQGYGFRSFYRRHMTNYEISKIATLIEVQVQSWVDQKRVKELVQLLLDSNEKEEKLGNVFVWFQNRLSSGFNSGLQEVILKSKVFPILETMVCDIECSKRVREQSAHSIVALVEFNKDVFVGQVLMGNTIEALVSMASCDSIQVLASLIKLVKIPLVYEMEENDYIPKITSLLSSKDLSDRLAALECVLELTYFARKEAIEAMLEEGLINKLLELQNLEIVHDSSDEEIDFGTNLEIENKCDDTILMENNPFTSCVTRFVGRIEMGECLEKKEKRELKLKILRRIKEASGSELEATSVVAEVLWGSSPLLS